MKNDRITFIIGAGAPLDLELPTSILKPSTANITQEVIKPYDNPSDKAKIIHIVSDVYYRLMDYYPHPKNIKPDINFEQVFHVLEMLHSYGGVWEFIRECRYGNNPKGFPPFAPFIEPVKDLCFKCTSISSDVLNHFIIGILDIINLYNKEFKTNIEHYRWYRDFFAHFGSNSDFFNLNYDITIEESIGKYEDGYEIENPIQCFQRFNPKKLFDNTKNLSTINHLHGCINYYFSTYKNPNEDTYTYRNSDLFKYTDYAPVRKKLETCSRANFLYNDGSSYYPSPIITGLRKTDKLNCAPFDFYHAHLVNCIVKSPKLVIIGYGFGDSYCNQILERMNFLHGEKRRVVLIDKWNIPDILDNRSSSSNDLWMFLCRIMQCASTSKVLEELLRGNYEEKKELCSKNGCVMVLPHGFKEATYAIDEIENFLNG